MEQLVLCMARSNVEVAEGDGPAISEILMNLQPDTEDNEHSLKLHLLANAFKQARFLPACLPLYTLMWSTGGHSYLNIVKVGTTYSTTSVALW